MIHVIQKVWLLLKTYNFCNHICHTVYNWPNFFGKKKCFWSNQPVLFKGIIWPVRSWPNPPTFPPFICSGVWVELIPHLLCSVQDKRILSKEGALWLTWRFEIFLQECDFVIFIFTRNAIGKHTFENLDGYTEKDFEPSGWSSLFHYPRIEVPESIKPIASCTWSQRHDTIVMAHFSL